MDDPSKAYAFCPAAPPGVRAGCATLLSGSAPLLALTLCTGCLVTDPPQFNPPKHSAPFLVEASADPNPRKVVTVDTQLLATTDASKVFSADVISQDDPADSTGSFKEVHSALYIDYGFTEAPGQAFIYDFFGNVLPPGTLDQTSGRRLSAKWLPGVARVDPGCHTVTLVASHGFDPQIGCPSCLDDYSTITWQVLRCDSTKPGDCDQLPVTGAASCAGLTNSCEQVAAAGGGWSCAETSDGGTP